MSDHEQLEQLEPEPMKPRRSSWVVVILALLFSDFVFVFLGRFRRALGWFAFSWLVAYPAIAFIMLSIPLGKVSFFFSMSLILAVIVVKVIDALKINNQQTDQPKASYQIWWAYLLFIIIYFVLLEFSSKFTKKYIAEAYLMPTSNMRESLLPGDRFIVDKLFLNFNKIKRGNVVLYCLPENDQINYVHRVLAIEGDSIEIDQQKVFVNGNLIEEPYVVYSTSSEFSGYRLPKEMVSIPSTVVPEGHFFVLGDNRWESFDSRMLGMIPNENFIGNVRSIFWSRELSYSKPTRENPRIEESWGSIRWDRIGLGIKTYTFENMNR